MVRDVKIKNVSASIRARLLNKNREVGKVFELTLRRYGGERFLYRLGESKYRDHFILKGAMLLLVWGNEVFRPTRDIDFTGYGSSRMDDVRSTIREICLIPCPEDGIMFNCEKVEVRPIRPDDEYDGLQARFEAMLEGARIPMRIDIGFGDVIHPPPSDACYPTLLGGPPPRIRIYPRESVVAEKFHAMVLLQGRNTRYKDFYDVYGLALHFAFEGECLTKSIGASFVQRGTAISVTLPIVLTAGFYANADRAIQWHRYLDQDNLSMVPANFGVTGELLRSFLTGPWDALARNRKFAGSWPEGGPWLH